MAIVATDGFDMYSGIVANIGLAAKWTVDHGTPSMVAGRFGGQAVQLPAAPNTGIIRPMTAVGSLAFGVAIKISSLTGLSGLPMVACASGGLNGFIQNTFYAAAGGVLKAGRVAFYNSAPTELASSGVGVLFADTWHYLEGEIVISDTVGRLTAWVDGTQVLNVTGVDTKQQASATADVFLLQTAAGSGNTQYDDFYLADTAVHLGPRKIETLRGSADTATKNWVPNSGSVNYDRVNETLVDGDTTYVQASTVGTDDLYDLGNLSSIPVSIDAVNAVMFARKTDAAVRSVYETVKSGATSSDGIAATLASGYGRFDRLLLTDPDTGVAWTGAGVNALQIGPKVAV